MLVKKMTTFLDARIGKKKDGSKEYGSVLLFDEDQIQIDSFYASPAVAAAILNKGLERKDLVEVTLEISTKSGTFVSVVDVEPVEC